MIAQTLTCRPRTDIVQWPAIIGIIIGSVIVISIIWCCARCLCCGAECCCACCSCFNRCCPSPRRSNKGYEQPSAQPYQQYQSHPLPMYGGGAGAYGGYSGPQTARFDAPSQKNGNYNEDSLPAMPSWDQAQSKRVENNDLELEKLDHNRNSSQQEALLSHNSETGALGGGGRYYNQNQPAQANGDVGMMHASPYREHDYDSHQQFVGSPVSSVHNSMYPPTYHTNQPESVYGDTSYAPSIPPSYHTAAPSIVSPVQQNYAARRPVQGSWRDV